MKKLFSKLCVGGVLLFSLSMSLTSCEDVLGHWEKPVPVTPSVTPAEKVAVTSITLNKATAPMLIGGTETLTVETVAPDNATDKTVTWTSDNTAAATVDESTGAITGVAAGTATITATAKDGSGVTATCTVYVGLLSGKFTINASGDQIQFAQGNLQAKTDNLGVDDWTWTFATNQWDYIGNNPANNRVNGYGTVSGNGTVDLFGWVGESNTTWSGDLGTQGNAAMHGISDHKTYPYSTDNYGNVPGENLKSDWGAIIGAGWRTLNKDEWTYLLNTRSGSTVNATDNARYTKATINTDGTAVRGLILFPDGETIANDEAGWGDINGWDEWGTTCTTAQWTALAAKGCVFLPASGYREGGTVTMSTVGGSTPPYYTNYFVRYWSSTTHDSDANDAYAIDFKTKAANASSQFKRHVGHSVRLVYPAQ